MPKSKGLLILRCHNTEISQTMWSDQGKAQYLIRNLTPKLKGFPHPRGTIHGPITTEWVRSRGGPANLCQNERVLLVLVRGTTCTIYRSITNNVVRSRKGPVSYYNNNQIKGFSSPRGATHGWSDQGEGQGNLVYAKMKGFYSF